MKRHGKADPLDQWVTCTVRDLVAILTGSRVAGSPVVSRIEATR